MPASFGATADVDRYDEAIDWFLRRTVMTVQAAQTLDDRLKVEAFWVGGGLQLTQIQRVFDEIAVAQEKGEPFEAWRKRVRGELRNDAHAETVFRNATQRSLNAGRWAQMNEPASLQLRPFWLYDAVLDSRTTVICRDADGTLLPAGNEWFIVNWPPRHHRCRSNVRNLRRAEALKRGVTTQIPAGEADKGFGHAPGTAPPWKPDPAKHEPALIAELDRKAEKGTKSRKARPKAEHDPKHWLAGYEKRYGDAAPALAHGKAALERGLDMQPADALKLLEQLDVPGAARMREALKGLVEGRDEKRTLRELGAEIEPLSKAAAAVAGHIKSLPRKAKISLKRRATDAHVQRVRSFYERMSHPDLVHPVDWSIARVGSRSSANAVLKRMRFVPIIGELEHEWGHAIDALNPLALKRTTAFLAARTKGLKIEKLKDVLHGGYRDDEVAWRDDFAHIYVGKKYARPNGEFVATELTSMGVEMLAAGHRSHLTLAQLMAQDPEHLFLTLGVLAGA